MTTVMPAKLVTINGKDYLPGVLYPAGPDMPKDREFLAYCKNDFPSDQEPWGSFQPEDQVERIGIFDYLVQDCRLDSLEGWIILKWDDPNVGGGDREWFMTGSHLTEEAIAGNPVWWTPLPENV